MLPDSADIDRRLEFFSELLSCQNHFYRWVYDSDGFLQQTNCKDLALNKLLSKVLPSSIFWNIPGKVPLRYCSVPR